MRIEDIPEEEREYIIPGQTGVCGDCRRHRRQVLHAEQKLLYKPGALRREKPFGRLCRKVEAFLHYRDKRKAVSAGHEPEVLRPRGAAFGFSV